MKTIKPFLYIVITLLLSSSTLFGSDQARVNELRAQRRCHLSVGPVVAEYGRLQKIWLTDNESKYNIHLHFERLKGKHASFHTKLVNFTEKYSVIPETRKELEEQLRSLHTRDNDLMDTLGESLHIDNTFLHSLNSLEDALLSQEQKLSLASQSCKNDIKEEIRKLIANIKNWLSQLEDIRLYIVKSKEKRLTIVQKIKQAFQKHLEAKWAESANENLTKLQSQISLILKADKLYDDINEWYHNYAVKGPTSKLMFQYLQYERPLALMRVAYQKGLKLKERSEALNLPPMTRKKFDKRLNNYLSNIRKNLNTLKTGGWKMQLANQKKLNDRRLQLLNQLSDGCEAAINNYNTEGNKVSVLSEYRRAEVKYISVVKSCLRR